MTDTPMPKEVSLFAEFVKVEITFKIAEAFRLLGEASQASQVAVHRKSELGAAASDVEFPTPASISEAAEVAEVCWARRRT